ncbi:MAG: cyclase family protein, partial [Abditibacteriota bacterium]|nr:cyclase family protein [Abditibacteriota bacterium]
MNRLFPILSHFILSHLAQVGQTHAATRAGAPSESVILSGKVMSIKFFGSRWVFTSPSTIVIPADRMILPCALIDCGGKMIPGDIFDDVYVRTEALLIRTGHCEKAGKPEYFTDFPSFTEQAVKRVINRRIKNLALDTPSLSTNSE